MLSVIHAATSCCKSNHDKDLSEHLSDDPWVFSLHKVKEIYIFMLCIYINIVFEES